MTLKYHYLLCSNVSRVATKEPYIPRFVVTAYSDLAIRLGRNEDQVQGGINLLLSRATRYTVR
jgi:hypothetical protein